MFYHKLWNETWEVRRRAARGLLGLRNKLEQEVPLRSVDRNLLIATWNIREFDSEKFGPRPPECFYYIAEIISHFDLIAIQEVREDLKALNRVKNILGGWWKYLVTDVTYGASGNGERLAFLFDSRKLSFSGLAGEVVLPEKKGKSPRQIARTPFVCGFRAGWTKFDICTVHIYYGKSVPDDPRRVAEIRDLSSLLAEKVTRRSLQPDGDSYTPEPDNLILLGDFNVFKREKDATFKALAGAGFDVPPEIRLQTNAAKNKDYDQIAFLKRNKRFESTGKAGVFDFYACVYTEEDKRRYKFPRNIAYNQWRTYQMSDHLVLWTELRIDFSTEYLKNLRKPKPAELAAEGRPAPRRRSTGRRPPTGPARAPGRRA